MDFVTFKSLDVVRRDGQQPIRYATQRRAAVTSRRSSVRLRPLGCDTFSPAFQPCAGISVKDGVCHGPGILLKAVTDPRFLHLIGCCRHVHGPAPITRRPDTCSHGSRTNIHRLPAAQGSGSLPYRI
jgi:hypothetical protein